MPIVRTLTSTKADGALLGRCTGRPAMAPKKKPRAASAPPQRPAASGGASGTATAGDMHPDDCTLDGELLPTDKGYDSERVVDGPADTVEDEDLLGVAETLPCSDPAAAAGGASASPARQQSSTTGATAATKQLTAPQTRFQADQAQWSALKTDGTETRRLERPAFRPYKENTAPEGCVAGPQHETGGPSPEVRKVLYPSTAPWIYVAEIGGFDGRLFRQFTQGSTTYAQYHRAGADDHYPEFKSFSNAEMWLLAVVFSLRQGVAPCPRSDLLFKDPKDSFIFGDARIREVWPGKGCGGSERRWQHFRSFFVPSVGGLFTV